MKSVCVFLLALVVVAALAAPHHQAKKQAHKKTASKAHAKFDKLERHARDEEELDTPTEFPEIEIETFVPPPKQPVMVALDCGSSGTKLSIFAKSSGDCPEVLENPHGRDMHICPDGIKYKPTMSDNDGANWNEWLATPTHGSTTTRVERTGFGLFVGRVAKLSAWATAGNRIIDSNKNQTAWTNLLAAVKTRFGVDFEVAGTIPGTKEAFLEYIAAGESNFISMGGASAQLGVRLDTLGKLAAWVTAIRRGFAVTTCNNQDSASHFFITLIKIDDNPLQYTDVVEVDELSTCQYGKCVGLMSWLTAEDIDDDDACKTGYTTGSGKPTEVNHWAGGIDQSKERFREYITGLGEQAKCYGGAADAEECAAALIDFSQRDLSTKIVRDFMTQHNKREPFAPFVMAALSKALTFYQGYQTSANVQVELRLGGGNAGKAIFALWGVQGLIVATHIIPVDHESNFAFGAAAGLRPNPVSWIATNAASAGYTAQCPLVNLIEPNAERDGNGDPEEPCEVDLSRPELVPV